MLSLASLADRRAPGSIRQRASAPASARSRPLRRRDGPGGRTAGAGAARAGAAGAGATGSGATGAGATVAEATGIGATGTGATGAKIGTNDGECRRQRWLRVR